VLQKEWDPIWIQSFDDADDEYDAYVPTIYSMLIARKPVSTVLEYLLWLETEHMGHTVDRQRTQDISEKIVGLV
jgi:hypothetical protein